jgi:hypothetical protein
MGSPDVGPDKDGQCRGVSPVRDVVRHLFVKIGAVGASFIGAMGRSDYGNEFLP